MVADMGPSIPKSRHTTSRLLGAHGTSSSTTPSRPRGPPPSTRRSATRGWPRLGRLRRRASTAVRPRPRRAEWVNGLDAWVPVHQGHVGDVRRQADGREGVVRAFRAGQDHHGGLRLCSDREVLVPTIPEAIDEFPSVVEVDGSAWEVQSNLKQARLSRRRPILVVSYQLHGSQVGEPAQYIRPRSAALWILAAATTASAERPWNRIVKVIQYFANLVPPCKIDAPVKYVTALQDIAFWVPRHSKSSVL
ncbi:hypothetical protein PG988_004490 [Apiospora saccharicola]